MTFRAAICLGYLTQRPLKRDYRNWGWDGTQNHPAGSQPPNHLTILSLFYKTCSPKVAHRLIFDLDLEFKLDRHHGDLSKTQTKHILRHVTGSERCFRQCLSEPDLRVFRFKGPSWVADQEVSAQR
jgi:hypothetical protein